MSWRGLVRLGLALLLLALVAPVMLETVNLAERNDLDSLVGWFLRGAGILLGLALVLYVLEKVGLKVSGARCVTCKRRISYGHAYCYDHLRDMTLKARERYHGERGSGV